MHISLFSSRWHAGLAKRELDHYQEALTCADVVFGQDEGQAADTIEGVEVVHAMVETIHPILVLGQPRQDGRPVEKWKQHLATDNCGFQTSNPISHLHTTSSINNQPAATLSHTCASAGYTTDSVTDRFRSVFHYWRVKGCRSALTAVTIVPSPPVNFECTFEVVILLLHHTGCDEHFESTPTPCSPQACLTDS